MSVRRLLPAALLVGLAVASPNAELPTRIFHIGIVAGTPRSSPERVAFEDRLRELGYVEGRNLAIDYDHYDSLDHGAAAVGEMAQRRFDVLLIGAGEDRRRDRQAERRGRLEIDHQFEPGRLLDRQIGGFGSL